MENSNYTPTPIDTSSAVLNDTEKEIREFRNYINGEGSAGVLNLSSFEIKETIPEQGFSDWKEAFVTMPRTIVDFLKVEEYLKEHAEEMHAEGCYLEYELKDMTLRDIAKNVAAVHGNFYCPDGYIELPHLQFVTGNVEISFGTGVYMSNLQNVGNGINVLGELLDCGVEEVQNYVSVGSDAIAHFSKLTHVGSDIDVVAGDDCVTMENLVSCGGDLKISGDIELNKLEHVEGVVTILRGGDLKAPALSSVGDNMFLDRQASISADSLKKVIGSLKVSTDAEVSFKSLALIGDEFEVNDFVELNLPSLEECGDLYVGDDAKLLAPNLKETGKLDIMRGVLETNTKWILCTELDKESDRIMYNYRDSDGNTLSIYDFDEAERFEDGLAKVTVHGVSFQINENAKITGIYNPDEGMAQEEAIGKSLDYYVTMHL